MTLTLEDVALLFGLLCGGDAMGAHDILESWREDLLARFSPVVRNFAKPTLPFSPRQTHEPTATWLR
jgi:hypothetical protein